MYKKMKNFVNKEVKKCKVEYYSDYINRIKEIPASCGKPSMRSRKRSLIRL